MIRFLNDYSEGAHPQVLQSLIEKIRQVESVIDVERTTG